MNDFTLKEYTEKEYRADMQKLLSDKGLYKAVNDYCDKINDATSALSYLGHREVQEYLCDILYLIELDNNSTK